MTTPKKPGTFHSYTLAEAEQSSRVWAAIALLGTSFGLMLCAQLGHALSRDAYYPDTGLIFAFGVLKGVAAVGAFTGLWLEVKHIKKVTQLRKAYKKEHPELFDSAGDPTT